jgi:hypothetical protein
MKCAFGGAQIDCLMNHILGYPEQSGTLQLFLNRRYIHIADRSRIAGTECIVDRREH